MRPRGRGRTAPHRQASAREERHAPAAVQLYVSAHAQRACREVTMPALEMETLCCGPHE